MEIVQAEKKFNSISRERLNFQRGDVDGRFCVQLCIETPCKRPTSVAHLTNFSFECFYKIFTEDASLPLLYHGLVQKSQKWLKTQIKGGGVLVARNEVENASFAQRSAHRDSRIWRPAAERKRRARGRRPTFKSAHPDPQILPQCNISSNYPYNVWFFWVSRHRSIILEKKWKHFRADFEKFQEMLSYWNVNWSQKHLGILPSSLWNVFLKFCLQMNPIPMRKKQLLSISSSRF